MEKFYFERPSIERKNEIIEYLDEFVKYGSDINGSGSLDKIYDGYTFEQALDRCLKMEDEEYAKSVGRCQGKTFLLIRESDNKIVGMVNIRHCLNRILSVIGGHIGGSIRPTERGKGYAKIQLYLSMLECKELGLDRVMLDCAKTNIKSEKAIQSIGGEFNREFYYQPKKEFIRNYWVDVDKAIDSFKDTCGKQVLKKKRK